MTSAPLQPPPASDAIAPAFSSVVNQTPAGALPEKSSSNATTHDAAYRPEIDGLRAFAIVAVIINHFHKPYLPSGYLGVDVFFAVSGFVVTASLFRQSDESLRGFLAGFYSRRIKRLMPALVLFVVIASILISIFNRTNVASLRTGMAASFGASNIYLFKQATDYFGTWSELNIFTHTWSLGVEEQFYVVFPFLFWLTTGRRNDDTAVPRLFWLILGLSILSLASFLWLDDVNQPAAYFLMPTRFWELGAGILTLGATRNSSNLYRRLHSIPAIVVFVLLVAALFLPSRFGVYNTIVVVVLTSLLVTTLKPGDIVCRLLSQKYVVHIGLLSYSLYLWHWGILSLSRWTIGIHWWSVPIQVFLMLALANLSYRFVETRLRHRAWGSKRWHTLVLGFAMVSAAFVFNIGLLAFGPTLLFSGKRIAQDDHASKPPAALAASNATPKRGTLFLMGDSHAGHLQDSMANVAEQQGLRFRIISLQGTAFPPVYISTPVGGATYSYNRQNIASMLGEYNQAVKDAQFEVEDIFFISNFYLYYFGNLPGIRKNQPKTFHSEDGSIISQTQAFEDWLNRLDQFAAKHARSKIVLLLSTPIMPEIYPEEACSPQWFRPNPPTSCSMFLPLESMRSLHQSIHDAIAARIARYPNVFMFDPTDTLCNIAQSRCPSHLNGRRLFNDEDHLTAYGSDMFATALTQYLSSQKVFSATKLN